MAMVISFAWTTPALLAGRKTVTRREWSPAYAARFHAGDLVTAYDRSPRNGGQPVATLGLRSVTYEPLRDMPDADYEAEGFAYLHEYPQLLPLSMPYDVSPEGFNAWRASGGLVWVVRFERVELLPTGAIEAPTPLTIRSLTPLGRPRLAL